MRLVTYTSHNEPSINGRYQVVAKGTAASMDNMFVASPHVPSLGLCLIDWMNYSSDTCGLSCPAVPRCA